MIIIEYHRFVLEPRTTKLGAVFYHEEFDHSEIMQDAEFDLVKIKKMVTRWEMDHYGYAQIFIPNEEGQRNFSCYKLSNKKKFKDDMQKLIQTGIKKHKYTGTGG